MDTDSKRNSKGQSKNKNIHRKSLNNGAASKNANQNSVNTRTHVSEILQPSKDDVQTQVKEADVIESLEKHRDGRSNKKEDKEINNLPESVQKQKLMKKSSPKGKNKIEESTIREGRDWVSIMEHSNNVLDLTIQDENKQLNEKKSLSRTRQRSKRKPETQSKPINSNSKQGKKKETAKSSKEKNKSVTKSSKKVKSNQNGEEKVSLKRNKISGQQIEGQEKQQKEMDGVKSRKKSALKSKGKKST